MSRVLQVRGLRYAYPGGARALDGVDFDLEAGECVAVLGPNGSGKTTFLLHLNGLLPGEGSVQVCGIAVRPGALREVRAKIGLVFQDPDDQLFMPTVLEDAAFGPRNLGLPREEAEARARAALERVGMAHALDRTPYHLSAGEKRRAAIAGVLAMEPEILVLDEPTTFLDPPAQRELIHLLQGLPQAKLVVTHDAAVARALASRAVFFERGRITAGGPVEEVIRRFAWDFPGSASPDRR
jgi:cobalt/nickel transport system ATP-binding protein